MSFSQATPYLGVQQAVFVYGIHPHYGRYAAALPLDAVVVLTVGCIVIAVLEAYAPRRAERVPSPMREKHAFYSRMRGKRSRRCVS
jgi:hypothetical protein